MRRFAVRLLAITAGTALLVGLKAPGGPVTPQRTVRPPVHSVHQILMTDAHIARDGRCAQSGRQPDPCRR
jgi:hypothetical protein